MSEVTIAGIVYRPVSKADFEALARLWTESWRSTGLALTVFATEAANRLPADVEIGEDHEITVAMLGGRLVGFLAIKPPESTLDQLFVVPDMLGKGIGRQLLAHAMKSMPDGFTIRIAADNLGTSSFYEHYGLQKIGTETHPALGHVISVYRWDGASAQSD